jgi:predicted nucleic acid-binding protein
MSRIYWDTMLFVYWLENKAPYAQRVQKIMSRMEQRSDKLCTSILAVGELLVGPRKTKDAQMDRVIRGYFQTPAVELLPFNWETAEIYSRIRAENNVSPADSIHLASAAQARADLFLTNDLRLCRLTIPGIHFIAGLDTNLF